MSDRTEALEAVAAAAHAVNERAGWIGVPAGYRSVPSELITALDAAFRVLKYGFDPTTLTEEEAAVWIAQGRKPRRRQPRSDTCRAHHHQTCDGCGCPCHPA